MARCTVVVLFELRHFCPKATAPGAVVDGD
jgi:hypothetical protein